MNETKKIVEKIDSIYELVLDKTFWRGFSAGLIGGAIGGIITALLVL